METEYIPGWGIRFTLAKNGLQLCLENLEGARYPSLRKLARPLRMTISKSAQSPQFVAGGETGLTTKTPDDMIAVAMERLIELLEKPVMTGCVSSPASFTKNINEEWVVNGGTEIPW